jgi:sugar lactone lactonase YvrE
VSTLTAGGDAATFANPSGVTVATDGTVYVAPYSGSEVLRFVPGDDDAPEVVASGLSSPSGVALDDDGTLYIAEQGNNRILKVEPGQSAEVFAGDPQPGFVDGTGIDARFDRPTGVDVAPDGTVVVADRYNNAVRAISPSGAVSTLAVVSNSGLPTGVAATATTVYVAVEVDHIVMSIDRATGVVTELAGSGAPGGDDGIGASASFSSPTGLAVGTDGMLYVAEFSGNRIRAIDPATAAVTTVSGTGAFGSDDGSLDTATFSGPYGLDQAGGRLYVAEFHSGHIRRIELP